MEIIKGDRKYVRAWKENVRNKRKKWAKIEAIDGQIA